MRLTLPTMLDLGAAPDLAASLRAGLAPDGAALELDGSEVSRVGQACLQVLASARITAERDGRSVRILSPSDELRTGIDVAGLSAFLL